MKQKLIPLIEYSRLVGVPESTLRFQIREGRLRAIRLGRYWYVPVEAEVTEPKHLAEVYTLFTHAGGAGKTSLARDLGFELASQGYKVLLIDSDPQANLTAWLGLNPGEVEDRATLLSVVEGRGLPEPQVAVVKGANLDLIPANMNLAMAEVTVPTKALGMVLLRTALHESGILDQYDFVLVDSPPSLGPIAAMAALASQGLIVPIETSAKGVQAFKAVVEVSRDYLKTLKALRFIPQTQAGFIALLVPTKYDPRTLQDRKVKRLLEEASRIGPMALALSYRPGPYKEAIDRGLPIQAVADDRLREEIRLLTQTFLERVRRSPWE